MSMQDFMPICAECPPGTACFPNRMEAEFVCMGCGIVLEERCVNESAELFREFKQDHSSVGAVCSKKQVEIPTTNQPLATCIGYSAGPISNNVAQLKLNQTKPRLSTLQKKTMVLSNMCETMHLASKTTQTASSILAKLFENRSSRSKIPPSVLAACIYLGCKQTNASRDIKDIIATFKIEQRDFTKKLAYVSKLTKEQEDKQEPARPQPTPSGSSSNKRILQIRSVIERALPELQQNYSLLAKANDLLPLIMPQLEGKRPSTIAGVYVLHIMGDHNLALIAKAMKISQPTLRQNAKLVSL